MHPYSLNGGDTAAHLGEEKGISDALGLCSDRHRIAGASEMVD